MEFAKSYRDLEVYRLSQEVTREIFLMTRDFPRNERYSLTDQVRRSSRSIGAQIAESWGKRRYVNHFISKLTDSDSEQFETQHWIDVAYENEYITEEIHDQLITKLNSIGKMLNSMIDKAERFCPRSR